MENRPVIHLSSRSPAPGADVAVYERYVKWVQEVYAPSLEMKIPEVRGNDFYQITRENPQYGARVSTVHFKNMDARKASL
jgi:hypothetical protein